jgi:hypothetical protein
MVTCWILCSSNRTRALLLLPPRACSLVKLFITLTLGWPLYLAFNVASRPYEKSWVNHFDPWSPIFR